MVRVSGHNKRDGSCLGIQLLVYDPDENVTLGEDAGQLALIDDRQNANPELNHHGDRVATVSDEDMLCTVGFLAASTSLN